MRLNDRYTERLSFDIGTAQRFEDVTANDIEVFFAVFDLTGSRYRRFLQNEVKPLFQRLDILAENLLAENMKAFDDLIGNNLMQLNERLGLGSSYASAISTSLGAAAGWLARR